MRTEPAHPGSRWPSPLMPPAKHPADGDRGASRHIPRPVQQAQVPDIIEVILADHRRIQRLLAALRETARYGGGPEAACSLAHLWHRLADLLGHHAEAEQEIWYPALFGQGRERDAELDEAVADHDDIRETLQEAVLHPVGSPCWCRAVAAASRLTTGHLAGEERGLLTAFVRHATPELRRELGRQWTVFTSARRTRLPSEPPTAGYGSPVTLDDHRSARLRLRGRR